MENLGNEKSKIKDWQNLNETNIPLPLFLHAIKEGNIKPCVLKTYLFLKLYYPDRFAAPKTFKRDLAAHMRITVKTLTCHFNQLLNLNLIGFDKSAGIVYVRSKYHNNSKSDQQSQNYLNEYLYSFKISKNDLQYFTEYLIAAAISYIIRLQKNSEMYKAALKNDGTLQALYKRKNDPVAIPLSYIAKFLNKSISWVDKYKKKAQQLNLITITKTDFESTGIRWEHRRAYLRSTRIPSGRIRKRNNEVYLVAADLLFSSVYLKKRKKVYG